MRFSFEKCKLRHPGTYKLKIQILLRRMKQHTSEIEWDVILNSRAVRILQCETTENSGSFGSVCKAIIDAS